MLFLSLITTLVLLLAVSCNGFNDEPIAAPMDGGRIGLELSRSALSVSRTVASTDIEAAVSFVDVFFFDSSEATYHYERVTNLTAHQGTIFISKSRNDFEENQLYSVYLIANSTLPQSDFAAIGDLSELRMLTQVDERIHMTGLQDVADAPKYFLMEGQAYAANSAERGVPVVINNGVPSDDTILGCELIRAAAKVIVRLYQGENVQFERNYHAGYYFRNMPYNTYIMPDHTHKALLRTPDKTASAQFFNWAEDNSCVTVVGYFYSHDRGNDSFFERGTSLIVNIPIAYTTGIVDGVPVVSHYENSYYQLQLSRTGAFERNHIYQVSATINAPGAEELSVPIDVENIHYSELDWTTEEINVGGEVGPKYLKVNHTEMEMHNKTVDNQTLVFASSDPVSTQIRSIYYIDKFGQTQTITSRANSLNISATPLASLAGNIEVTGDVPDNNTIRYIDLRVYQDDNSNGRWDSGELYEDVLVKQHPVIYITNQQGYYSYREDFGTHYQKKGTNRYVAVGLSGSRSVSGWTWNGGYTRGNDSYSNGARSTYFWHAKYVSSYNEATGKSTTSFYNWSTNSTAATASKDGNCETNANARMYHIRVTSTSGEYVVGRPRLDSNGYTDGGADNAKLVSPSFMIASRLGALYSTYGNLSNIQDGSDDNNNGIDDRLEIYSDHCKNYAETYMDENGTVIHYTDWRVPTEAEIKIIISLQGSSGEDADAIDYLLNGRYYMSASGPVYNHKGDQNNSKDASAVRCVRDAY